MSKMNDALFGRSLETGLGLEDLLNIAGTKEGPCAAQTGPRSRRRVARARIAETSAIAALLGIQGCVPIAPGRPSIVPEEPAPPAPTGDPNSVETPTTPVESFPVTEVTTSEIPVADLLATQHGAQSVIAVTGAENGTAQLRGGIVHFTPNEGFVGPASIAFTYRDAADNVRTGRLSLTVDEHGVAHAEHGDGGDHMDHGDGMGGDGDDNHEGHGDGEGEEGESGESGQEGHGGDMGGEMSGGGHAHHQAVLALVPVDEATHVAVKDGSWFDPSTWANGEVPGDGAKVVIPEGVTIAYDGQSAASLFTVRVDGQLDFATDQDTFMEVDTFVVSPTGHLTIGTVDNPVAANFEAVISIADNGPIDVSWDPTLLSRGLLSQGVVEINGAEKESFIRLAVDPMRGDTTLVLEDNADGWRVGDRLVLTGTHLTREGSAGTGEARFDAETQDEELVITAVNGNQVTVDHALQYDHEGARADLKAYLADYTRNVRILSEGGEDTPVHERGHTMFMASDKIDIRYAEFTDLGRTDKSERAYDTSDLDHIESDSNVKARYSLHLHRTGVDDPGNPAMIIGNAVWGSPGWGYVHHDSNAILSGNAAYDVFGAAFVAETGNETGRWSDNIAIKSLGVNNLVKDGEDVAAFDEGRTGAGFWFQGRLVDAVDNVAAGVPGGHGFVYMHRIPREDEILVDPDNVMQGDKLRYVDEAHINEPNIGLFAGNEAFAVRQGLEVIKANAQQGHDVRSVLEDFTAWEVWNGVTLQYTGHYTLKDFDLIATDQDVRNASTTIGIRYLSGVHDTAVIDSSLDGFNTGVHLRKIAFIDGIEDFRYKFIGLETKNGGEDFYNFDPSHDVSVSHASLVERTLSYESENGDFIFNGPNLRSDAPLLLTGTKTDSLGETETSTKWDPFRISFDTLRGAVEHNGYWTLDDGRKVTLVEEYISDRGTGEIAKFSVFVQVPTGLKLTPIDGNPWTAVHSEVAYNGVLDVDGSAPTARNDAFHVEEGQSVTLDLIANDSDPDGDSVSLDGITAARHGHVIQNENGTVTYFADDGYTGADSFFYWAADENGNFSKAEVAITVDA